jgi:hypothetical protein
MQLPLKQAASRSSEGMAQSASNRPPLAISQRLPERQPAVAPMKKTAT